MTGIGFVPPFVPNIMSNPVAQGAGRAVNQFTGGKAGQVANFAMNAYNQMSPEMQAYTMNKVTSVAGIAASAVKNGTGGRDTVAHFYGSNPRHSAGIALTPTPPPKSVSLDTGVPPNTSVNDYLDATENVCSPLHMTCGFVQFPTTSASAYKLYTYFNDVIAFELQSRLQTNVSFQVDITNTFTTDNILTAMNTLMYAHQVWHYYASTMSYMSDPRNHNSGIAYLNRQITPQMKQDFANLTRRLADIPCPPPIQDLMRYLFANFMSGDTCDAPIIRLCPLTPVSTGTDTTIMGTLLDSLANSNKVYVLMRRAVPQWVPGVMYASEPTPLYDDNFRTIFSNMPLYYRTSTSTTLPYPQVAASSDTRTYNTFTNKLDGVAFALTGMYNTVNSRWEPGLMSGISGTGTYGGNRLSYYKVGSTTQFYPSDNYPFLARSRQETYSFTGASDTVLSVHLFGTNMCQTVSSDAVVQTCLRAMDYLLAMNTIKIDVKKYNFGSTGSASQRKSKPKTKKSKGGKA